MSDNSATKPLQEIQGRASPKSSLRAEDFPTARLRLRRKRRTLARLPHAFISHQSRIPLRLLSQTTTNTFLPSIAAGVSTPLMSEGPAEPGRHFAREDHTVNRLSSALFQNRPSQIRQASSLLTLCVEVCRIKPSPKRGLQCRPLLIDRRIPSRVAIAAFVGGGLPKDAFKDRPMR